MNSKIFLFIAFASLHIYGSEQKSITTGKKRKADCLKAESSLSTIKSESITILPIIALTDAQMSSPEKNKLRNNLLFSNYGCIVAIKEFLSDEDKTLQISMAHAALHSDARAFKNAINNNLLMKKNLLPLLTRCFPKDQTHVRICQYDNKSSLLHYVCSSSRIFSNAKRQAQYNAQQIAILNYLIKNNVDVTAQDINGNSAMHLLLCRPYANIDCLKILKEAGANINAQNNNGDTPILLVAKNMGSCNHDTNVQVLEVLVIYGASMTKKNLKNESVWQILDSKYKSEHDHSEKINKICKNLGATN